MKLQSDVAMWLYGSHSRGDADEFSDVDVLIISERETTSLPIKQFVGTYHAPSVSCYSWTEIEQMARYGSLFLHHIALEGRQVFESAPVEGRLGHILSHLGPYRLAARDHKGFRIVLRDIAQSLDNGDASLIFELSTLATVFRHASILGCALSGNPCFSRTEPVAQLVARWNLPTIWARDFGSLYVFRMYADNRVRMLPTARTDVARIWCRRADALLDELGRRINDSN